MSREKRCNKGKVASFAAGVVERPSDGDMPDAPLDQLISVFEAIDEKIYVADPDSHEMLYANSAMKKLFGEDVVGKKCHKVMQDLEEPCDFCTNPMIFGKNLGRIHTWEFKNRKINQWRRCIDTAIRWSGGRMVRFEIAIDIHERKVAEEALQQSEKKYRQLVENINEVIYAMDREGAITYVSPAITDLTGFLPSEIEGRHFGEFIFRDDSGKIVGRFGKALLGQMRPTEYRILKKSGEYCWVRTFSKPIRDGDEVKGLQGVLSDITEQKRAEAALQAKEKELSIEARHLEEMNAALRVLLKTREQDKIDLEEKVLLNVNEHVIPYLEKLKKHVAEGKQKTYLDILDANIRGITSSFSRDLHVKYLHLTTTELHIAKLIREGKTSGEIASLMNVSSRTIESHRKNIRKKMGLREMKANLRATLMSLE